MHFHADAMPTPYAVSLTFAFAIMSSAALLWLGSAVTALGRSGPQRTPRVVPAAAMALVGVGIWCSPQALQMDDGLGLGRAMLPAVLAVLLAAASRATSAMAAQASVSKFAAAAIVTLGLAMGHVSIVTPGAFAAWGAFAPWGSVASATLLACALIALHLEREDNTHARVLRAGSALCAAAMLVLNSWMAASDADWAGTTIESSQVITVAALVLLASALMRVHGHGTRPPQVEAPIQSRVPSTDPLTKLPTRANFEERLAAQVAKADAAKDRLALLFIDLDGFKPVNDTFGHSAGDIVLRQVGDRLRSLSRSADMLTRIGGDEFVLMAGGNPTQEGVAQIARRLIDDISRPYDIGDREVVISCSVGIVIYPDSGAHTKLIARADAAMYEAKRSGGGCCCFYTPALDEDSRDKFDLVSDLRSAIDNKEMELFYQPKIDARSGQVTAAEALLRWKHPTRGMVPPAVFIPLAERFGLIGALGNWVIDDACRQARRWREHGLRMRLAVNLSALQMRQEDIVERIVGALERHQIHPSLLTCEITESVAMEDTKATQEAFLRLGKAGIHLSIDDFGTGYSSLSYLRRLPAEEIKIDRSFVMDLEASADARSVVDAVIKLAHALGLRVVAEGVENQRQQQILTEMACDEMQGYLFAKPMSARALLLWAIDDRPDTTAFRASLFGDTVPVQQDA